MGDLRRREERLAEERATRLEASGSLEILLLNPDKSYKRAIAYD